MSFTQAVKFNHKLCGYKFGLMWSSSQVQMLPDLVLEQQIIFTWYPILSSFSPLRIKPEGANFLLQYLEH